MNRFPIADCRMPNGRRIGRRAGFTLVEVLVSLAIVIVALPVAMEAITLTSATATRARRQLEAANLAASKLAELVATNAWQNGNSSGDFSSYTPNYPNFSDYTWTCTVTQYQEANTATTPSVTTQGTSLGSANSSGNTLGSGSTLGSSSTATGSTMGGTTSLAVTLEEMDVTVSWPAHNNSNTTFSVTVSTLVYPGK